ncbi:MAG: PilZ domain-containing protein [Terracidiphilus sp.]
MNSKVQRLDPKWRSAAAAASDAETKNDEQIELRRVECFLTEPLFKRFLRRLFPDQRRQERQPIPPLVGYLGTAHSSKSYDLGDISLTGFCLLTDERWVPGTEMPVTLKRTDPLAKSDLDCFTVQAKVVRCAKDGVGFSILLSEEESDAVYGNSLRVKWVTRGQMEQFLQRLREQPGSEGSLGEEPFRSESTTGAPSRAGGRLKTVFEGGR